MLREKISDLSSRFLPERTEGWFSTILFRFRDGGEWTCDINDGRLRFTEGRPRDPLSTVLTDEETFDRLFAGEIPLEIAMMTDRFFVDNIVEIFKFQTVFQKRER